MTTPALDANAAATAAAAASAAPAPAAAASFQSTRISVGSYEAHIGVDQWRHHWPTAIQQLAKDAAKYEAEDAQMGE